MEEIITGQWSKEGWKRLTKRMLLARSYSQFAVDCSHLPLAQCSTLKLGRPIPHISICRRTTKNNTRIRLLVNCYGLEAEVSRFRSSSPADSSCKLCGTGSTEDPVHFISLCPALSSARDSSAQSLGVVAPTDPVKFAEYILGVDWIDDPVQQRKIIEFVYYLHTACMVSLATT